MARYWFVLLTMVLAAVTRTTAQDTTARLFHNFTVVPNITYLTASNYESKLDLYVTRTPERPLPTLIYIHGGGWVAETKELRNLEVLPYLEMGMNVVNVDYRSPRLRTRPRALMMLDGVTMSIINPAILLDPRDSVAGGSAGASLGPVGADAPPSADRRLFRS